MRGRLRFYRQDLSNAAVDFARASAFFGVPYPAIWLFLARARMGSDGRAELAAQHAALAARELACAGDPDAARQSDGERGARRPPPATTSAARPTSTTANSCSAAARARRRSPPCSSRSKNARRASSNAKARSPSCSGSIARRRAPKRPPTSPDAPAPPADRPATTSQSPPAFTLSPPGGGSD